VGSLRKILMFILFINIPRCQQIFYMDVVYYKMSSKMCFQMFNLLSYKFWSSPFVYPQCVILQCFNELWTSIRWPFDNPIKCMKISFKCPNFKVASFRSLVLYLVSFYKFWIYIFYTSMVYWCCFLLYMWLYYGWHKHDLTNKLKGIKKNERNFTNFIPIFFNLVTTRWASLHSQCWIKFQVKKFELKLFWFRVHC
jgi:hypothetical protein